nr:hypothetical protein [Streptomyces antibioticus]
MPRGRRLQWSGSVGVLRGADQQAHHGVLFAAWIAAGRYFATHPVIASWRRRSGR